MLKWVLQLMLEYALGDEINRLPGDRKRLDFDRSVAIVARYCCRLSVVGFSERDLILLSHAEK